MPTLRLRNVKNEVYERALYYKAIMGCRSWGDFLRAVVKVLEDEGLIDD